MPIQSLIKEQFIEKLNGIIEANVSKEQFGVSELARDMGMSRSNLHRKLNSITNTSVSQYLRQFRLKQAMELLKETPLTVSEVSFMVGFGSVTYFSKCFRDYYGFPPGKAAANSLIEVENIDGQINDGNCTICGKQVMEVTDSNEQIIGVNPDVNKKSLQTILLSVLIFIILLATILYLV